MSASAASSALPQSRNPTSVSTGCDIYRGCGRDTDDDETTDDDAVEGSDDFVSDAAPERNVDELTHTALAADRYGVSNRAAAAIINAFQEDIGRLNSDDRTCIVDAKKSGGENTNEAKKRHMTTQMSFSSQD